MRSRSLLVLLVLLSLVLPAAPAQAAGVVSVCDEAHLRTALTGGGAVTFSCDGYITLANTITISSSTTIDGSGQNVTLSGGETVRLFNVKSGVTLSLVGLTVREGNDTSSQGGGAVLANGGNVSIDNCLFADNTASAFGGGVMIYNGALTVNDSTFSGDSAVLGGGISSNHATVTVSSSTFASNSTLEGNAPLSQVMQNGSGGGIYSEGGHLTVSNSTFEQNSATMYGGGIANGDAVVTVTNCTFAHNGADMEGNDLVARNDNTVLVKNTILAYSYPGMSCLGPINDGGANLSYPDTSCPGIHRNPLLQPLSDNGGPTFTMLLGQGSPAIDAGNDAVCAAPPVSGLDQRGVARPQGAHCDIGAVEQHPYSTANVLKVPDDYAAIQEAVDAASDVDEIWVAAGDYAENLSITRGATLLGGWDSGFATRTPGDSVIDGGGAGRVISITTTTAGAIVTIDGFTIQDGDATGLEPPSVPGPLLDEQRPERASPAPDPRTPTERAGQLQARLADLTARGLYRGGADAAQALLARLARLTLMAEQARTRAAAAPAQSQLRPQQDAGSGGGVYSENAALQLLNCTITDNVAAQEGQGAGGGVFVNGAPEDGLHIAGSYFGGNVATMSGEGWGGGLYLFDAPGALIEDNVVEDNIASYDGSGSGGGIYVYESEDAVVGGNQVRGNLGTQAGQGTDGIAGGLGLQSCANAVVHDNLIELNTASAAWDGGRGIGGGLFVTGSNGAEVRDNTVRENLALLEGDQGRGGGIQFIWNNYAEVAGNQISGNVAALSCPDAQGGGIKVVGVYGASLTGNEIRDNTAVVYGDVDASSFGHFGGGVYADEFQKSLLSDNEITGNAACTYCPPDGGFGGGAFISSSLGAEASGNTFTGNASALLDGFGIGGGLHLRDTMGSRVLRNRIEGNQAGMADGSHAGGLLLDHLEGDTAQAVVDGNVILDNRAGGDPAAATSHGGGSVFGMEEGLTFINNVVAGNHAAETGGFGLLGLPDGAEVANNTFAGNGDAGLLVAGSAVTLTNNIVVSHTLGVEVNAGASAALSYTLWNGNVTDIGGAGAISRDHPVTGDPAFVKPAAGDYRLTILSAARDAGDPAGVPPAPDHDADGVVRPQGAAVDIGAYEWQGYWMRLPLVGKRFGGRAGWAIGNNAGGAAAIVHTDDGGLTWTAQGTPALWTGMSGNDISAVDDQTAWAALGDAPGDASGAIVHTSDGGAHWVPQAIPAGLTGGIKGVKGLSRTEAWAASLGGTVLHTVDGGATWNVVPHPAVSIIQVNRIDALAGGDVWIAAPDPPGGNPSMIHSQDDGLTWRQESLPDVAAGHGPMTVNAVSPLVAWTALNQSGNVYRTLDGGAKWLKVAALSGMGDFDDLCAAGREGIWGVQTLGYASGWIWQVHVAADGSVESRKFTPASKAFSYEGVTCLDERTAWVVGWNPERVPLFRFGGRVSTVEGGEQWVQGSAPADIEYWKVSFAGARR